MSFKAAKKPTSGFRNDLARKFIHAPLVVPHLSFEVQSMTSSDAVLACFTKDMVDTLRAFFHVYQLDGVVTIQLTEQGLWLVHPQTGSRQFLGQAVLSEEEAQAQLRRLAEPAHRRPH